MRTGLSYHGVDALEELRVAARGGAHRIQLLDHQEADALIRDCSQSGDRGLLPPNELPPDLFDPPSGIEAVHAKGENRPTLLRECLD